MRKTGWIWKATLREFSQIPKNCAKNPDVKHPEHRNTVSTREHCRHCQCKTPLAMPSPTGCQKKELFYQCTALQSTSKTFSDGSDALCRKEQGLSGASEPSVLTEICQTGLITRSLNNSIKKSKLSLSHPSGTLQPANSTLKAMSTTATAEQPWTQLSLPEQAPA